MIFYSYSKTGSSFNWWLLFRMRPFDPVSQLCILLLRYHPFYLAYQVCWSIWQNIKFLVTLHNLFFIFLQLLLPSQLAISASDIDVNNIDIEPIRTRLSKTGIEDHEIYKEWSRIRFFTTKYFNTILCFTLW